MCNVIHVLYANIIIVVYLRLFPIDCAINRNITDVAQEVMLHNNATCFALGKMLSIQQIS